MYMSTRIVCRLSNYSHSQQIIPDIAIASGHNKGVGYIFAEMKVFRVSKRKMLQADCGVVAGGSLGWPTAISRTEPHFRLNLRTVAFLSLLFLLRFTQIRNGPVDVNVALLRPAGNGAFHGPTIPYWFQHTTTRLRFPFYSVFTFPFLTFLTSSYPFPILWYKHFTWTTLI